MKLTNEQAKQLHEKLAAEKNPAEAAKIAKAYGIDLSAEDVEKILDQVSSGAQALSDNEIEKVSGGNSNEVPENLTEMIRDYYRVAGPNSAFVLCIYYIPSPLCSEIITVIEAEEKAKKK